ncbi:MAG: response regulator, partial [Lachnospiraceae bacterium]|nr:response regulator [Lachnospiraceae bacterium]
MYKWRGLPPFDIESGVWQVIMMLSIAVCDDEIIECGNMAGRIKKILGDMKISCMVRQYNSARELLHASEKFDIVFLDIIMRDLDGMKAAHIFRKMAFDKILIFVSSSREYVFEAYDVEAFHYLL